MEKLDKIAEKYLYLPCTFNGDWMLYRDPEPYFVAMRNPEAFEKYDAEFLPKEKLVLPGQLG